MLVYVRSADFSFDSLLSQEPQAHETAVLPNFAVFARLLRGMLQTAKPIVAKEHFHRIARKATVKTVRFLCFTLPAGLPLNPEVLCTLQTMLIGELPGRSFPSTVYLVLRNYPLSHDDKSCVHPVSVWDGNWSNFLIVAVRSQSNLLFVGICFFKRGSYQGRFKIIVL